MNRKINMNAKGSRTNTAAIVQSNNVYYLSKVMAFIPADTKNSEEFKSFMQSEGATIVDKFSHREFAETAEILLTQYNQK